MSGTVAELGAGVEGFRVGDPVVVRPLDSRGETPADKGYSHISRNLKFLGIDTPGAFQSSWTVPAFTAPSRSPTASTSGSRRWPSRSPSPATTSGAPSSAPARPSS